MNSRPFIAQAVPVRALPLSKLHGTYQRENPSQNAQDKRHTARAFSLIAETMPGLDTESFGKTEFRGFRTELINRGYARSHCNKLMGKVKAVFKWDARYDLCPTISYYNLCLVEEVKYGQAKENPKREAVEDNIVNVTLPYLPRIVQDMIRFQRVTGMRPSEVCRMRIGFIKPFMRRDQSYMCCEFQEHKTARFGSIKYVPLDETAMGILKPYAFCENFPPEQFVFRTPCKKVQWTVSHWDRVLAETIEERGLPKWTLYQLRHTKGTELVIKEDIEVAAAVLGNSIEVMNRVYNHSRFDKMFRSIAAATPVTLKIYTED